MNAIVLRFPTATELSPGQATTVSVIALALVCFFAGLVAHTALAERIVRVLELSLLSKIPGYDYLKQASASALGVAEIDELPVVFVAMEGGWQFGIQVVAMADGLVAIFVPGAPNPASGAVFFFPAHAVRPAGISRSF